MYCFLKSSRGIVTSSFVFSWLSDGFEIKGTCIYTWVSLELFYISADSFNAVFIKCITDKGEQKLGEQTYSFN